MATIAKGMITLTSLNDAFSVSLSPNSCVINADFDGSNPKLANAYTNVTITRGDTPVKFDLRLYATSNQAIKYDIVSIDDYTKRIKLTGLPTDILSGFLEFEIESLDDFAAHVTFQFTIVRESTMLDWIQDWENNKTSIGSTYLITPKIFVGKKITTSEDLSVLTGVYIGPDSDTGAGIYGYKKGEEIFHINEYGGSIGGWDIDNGGIQTSDGNLKILSEGSIISSDKEDNLLWGIYKSGEAIFAKGNVQFHSDGSAYFKGSITSSSGQIGGWNITNHFLFSDYVILDAKNHYIGVSPYEISEEDFIDDNYIHKTDVIKSGGVCMYYTSANSYGIEGYLPSETIGDSIHYRPTFKLGNTNQIAGWSFDWESLWLGNKLNASQQYTDGNNSITIGTNGLRGSSWYIDTNGKISFIKGLISFDQEGGTIVGWKLNNQRMSTTRAAIISESGIAGLYLSINDISNIASASLANNIQQNGGIYLKTTNNDVELGGFNSNNKTIFLLSSTSNSQIAGWNFNEAAIFSGVQSDSGFTAKSGDITISNNGIRGFKWRFEKDGSGSLAGGSITWDADGTFSIGDSITNKTTITNGVVLTKSIYVCDSSGNIKAGMSAEGTGETGFRFFSGASDPSKASFRVDENGVMYASNAHIEGYIKAERGTIGGFTIGQGRIGVEESSEMSGLYNGLSLLSSLIKYSDSRSWVGFGLNVFPASTGMTGLCRLEYTGDDYDSGVGLLVKFRSANGDPLYTQQAINYDGNIFGIGGKAEFDDTYIGTAYTDIVQLHFEKTHTFIFTEISLALLALELPSTSQIQRVVGNKDVTFEIRIIVAHNSGNRIRVRGVAGTPLLDNNCNYINGDNGYLDMARGDTLIVRYCQSHYYLMEYKT